MFDSSAVRVTSGSVLAPTQRFCRACWVGISK